MEGRSYQTWFDGEQFAVLCYSHIGALKKVVYFDYLFDAQTFCTTCKSIGRYAELEIIRIRLNNVTDDNS